ncbi:hypothetical protein EAG18_08525 [Pseudoalteromonas sp. J010]|uniref:hypothetical protein n=1 Tax=Pseudoalteromonas sp. J010 TaxID=998465 RepID=UPI000F6488C4|nr:hypothetical protein [Pseudoalteromonas sp. J010]RRS09155.1 hypothetical protein EAG18_08525 [Pseudoalteromonas sp. J010]
MSTLNTLINDEAVKEIVHRWGSPAYIDTSSENKGARNYYLHGFVGRVPTPAELLYGTFAMKEGDVVTADATEKYGFSLDLRFPHLGSIELSCDHTDNHSRAVFGQSVRASGLILPEGVRLESAIEGMQTLPPLEGVTTSWMMDFSFDGQKEYTWNAGNRNGVIQAGRENKLTSGDLPTWFMISESSSLPTMQDYKVYAPKSATNPDGTKVTGYVSHMFYDYQPERRPIIVGTIGLVGSGADLQIEQPRRGYEFETITPLSLRIMMQ